jgi:two-component system phosphate regulon sensor histidine kinase PhoR
MERGRRDRLASFVLLPAVLVAVGTLAWFTFRTTLQVERLRQQSVLEATLALAQEKADSLDRQIIYQDNVAMTIGEPDALTELGERWLPTAQRETPTVRAIVVLDDARAVIAFASRASGAWTEEEAFRRLLTRRMLSEMKLQEQPPDQLRHLHREYGGQSYLVSYWQRIRDGRNYLVVAWHDVGRIVRDELPRLYAEAAPGSRVNVVDEEGRIIFGPPLRTGEFTVGVKFPTTLYNWRLQVAPIASEELASRVENRRLLEHAMVLLSSVVIVAGVVVILVAAERQRRMSALKSEFVANVSHELKTPLALVRMFGEMLQSGRVANEQKRAEYLEIIVRESERLSNLIENVLDFAKVERGKGAYDFAEGDVGEAVTRAVNIYRYRAERENVPLDVRVAPDLPRARIDERAIQLAVINLIDNALKYAPGGEVVVRAEREGGSIVVRVVDQGPGVPADDRHRIFERFVRGDSATRRNVRGSGIGLALVKHIAESHGGRAWVDSEVGRGSTFAIAIPARGAAAPVTANAPGAGSGDAEARAPEGPAEVSGENPAPEGRR